MNLFLTDFTEDVEVSPEQHLTTAYDELLNADVLQPNLKCNLELFHDKSYIWLSYW